VLRPFYETRSHAAQQACTSTWGDRRGLAVHVSEGAFFLWLWLRDLRIPTLQLYQRLKERNVLVVPGEYFFYGAVRTLVAQHTCLRITFRSRRNRREGIRRLAEEVARCYSAWARSHALALICYSPCRQGYPPGTRIRSSDRLRGERILSGTDTQSIAGSNTGAWGYPLSTRTVGRSRQGV